MLIKLNIDRLKDKQAEMTSIADRMETINETRIKQLIEINADQTRTLAWKSEAAEPLKNPPELAALNTQMQILVAVIEEQKNLWRDSAGLLRDAAVPRRDQMGVDAYTTAMAELGFLLNEAAALSQNASALQSALDSAVLREDWRSVYALTVGRIDPLGRALPSASGLSGTPLDCLPLPGRDESEAIFLQCELAKLRADAVMLCLSSGDTNPTADSSRTRLKRESSLINAQRKYDEAVKQRDRLRAAPTALERWVIFYKTGVDIDAVPSFEQGLEAAQKLYKNRAANIAAGLDDTETTVPEG